MKEGMVFDIQKFSIHDGPGIRTTVFLKGCSLKCCWCHNPESIEMEPEIAYDPSKCLLCGRCVDECPQGCHYIDLKTHRFARNECLRCGSCTVACCAGSLELIGERMSVDRVLGEVLKDVAFYKTSGGGMTLSGGEPMVQYAFSRELLRRGKINGLHNCLETNGNAAAKRYIELAEDVDVFLYDLKETDPDRHRRFTGAALDRILENLRILDSHGADIILRCPIIPGFNDRLEHLYAVAEIGRDLDHISEINLMPYHPMGGSKSSRIGKSCTIENQDFPGQDAVDGWLNAVRSRCDVEVRTG